jgi:hypothetical protein
MHNCVKIAFFRPLITYLLIINSLSTHHRWLPSLSAAEREREMQAILDGHYARAAGAGVGRGDPNVDAAKAAMEAMLTPAAASKSDDAASASANANGAAPVLSAAAAAAGWKSVPSVDHLPAGARIMASAPGASSVSASASTSESASASASAAGQKPPQALLDARQAEIELILQQHYAARKHERDHSEAAAAAARHDEL